MPDSPSDFSSAPPPPQAAQPTAVAVVDAVLRNTATVAIVGLSNRVDRPSYELGAYLQDEGMTVIPVHPFETTVLGQTVVRSVAQIPLETAVDTVCVAVRKEQVPAIVADTINRGQIANLWLQPASFDVESIRQAEAAGMTVVWGRDMMAEYSRRMNLS